MISKQQAYIAGLYCRISTDDGADDCESNSISVQKQILARFARENGIRVFEFYVDDGWSGVSFDRPSLQRMFADIEQGKINCVITKDLSRLGRNHILTGQCTDIMFPRFGVRYIAVNDQVDTLRGDNEIMPFKNILNEMYARDLSKKQKSSMENRRINGLFTGNIPPYGYMKDPDKTNHLIVDETAAEVMRRIFSLALDGLGGKAIATTLRRDCVPSPSVRLNELGYSGVRNSGNPYIWHEQTIRKMLRDPVYIGSMVGNKRPTTSFQLKMRIKTDPSDWVVVEGMHEPIIDRETFEAVQRIISKRAKPILESTTVLGGFLKCDVCGKTMAHTTQYSHRPSDHFCCRTYKRHGKESCSQHFIRTEDAYQIVLEDLREKARLALLDEKKMLKRLTAESDSGARKSNLQKEKSMDKYARRIKEIHTIIDSLYEDKALGRMDEARYDSMTARYNAEYSEIKGKLDELERSVKTKAECESNTRKFIYTIRKYTTITELTVPILSDTVDKVVVSERRKTPDGIIQQVDIYYRFVGKIG